MKIFNAMSYLLVFILTLGAASTVFITLYQYNRDLAIWVAFSAPLVYFSIKIIYWCISPLIRNYMKLKRSWVVYIAEFDKSNPLKVKHGYRRVVQAYDLDGAVREYINTYIKDIPSHVFNSNIRIRATRQKGI